MEIVVTVPAWTSAESVVYLTGDRRELGLWKSDGVRLRKQRDGTWRGKISLDEGVEFEFKVTLGRWDKVEKDSQGRDVANRAAVAHGGAVVRADVLGWGQTFVVPNSLVGELQTHERFYSSALGNVRTVWVWLPPGYTRDESKRYPVVYMQDGQNLFDTAKATFGVEWGVDEAVWGLVSAGAMRACVVVGIENTSDRFGEYTPTPAGGVGGRAGLYGKFITSELKPFIDTYYRTLTSPSDTFVAGSSLGGLVSLFLLREYPEVFGGCGALSPSLWWDGEGLLRQAERDGRWAAGKRVWLDMGTEESGWGDEGGHVLRTRRMGEALVRAGLSVGEDLRCEIVEGGQHNEAAWAARVGEVIRHLVGGEG